MPSFLPLKFLKASLARLITVSWKKLFSQKKRGRRKILPFGTQSVDGKRKEARDSYVQISPFQAEVLMGKGVWHGMRCLKRLSYQSEPSTADKHGGRECLSRKTWVWFPPTSASCVWWTGYTSARGPSGQEEVSCELGWGCTRKLRSQVSVTV